MKIEIVVNNRKKIEDELVVAVERALMECGGVCENYAKMDAPVDTGRLRNSMGHEMENENTVAIGSGVRTGDSVEYAIYQELGTSTGIKPKRFLTHALMNHVNEYKNIILKHLT